MKLTKEDLQNQIDELSFEQAKLVDALIYSVRNIEAKVTNLEDRLDKLYKLGLKEKIISLDQKIKKLDEKTTSRIKWLAHKK
jgi:predicted nuclease with TOPRIM domain